ncbi:MAG: hypothetical protein EOL93_09315 [Epsilonproteobacteria bacterium]|nr:hypothetical protein [Campylobacterota bacterium]
MKQPTLFLIVLLIAGTYTQGQENPKNQKYLYHNITEMGFLAGPISNTRPAPFTILNINGIQVHPSFAVGTGIGIEFIEETYMPVLLDLRYDLRTKKVSPFIGFQAGYNIALSKETTIYPNYLYDFGLSSIIPNPNYPYGPYHPRGGILLNPFIGFKNMFNENLGFIFSVGYRFQRMKYTTEYSNNNLQIEYHRLAIKFGFILN